MIALASILGLLGACEKRPPVEVPSRLVLTPVSYSELPGWAEDGQAEALPAFLRSCGRLERQPDATATTARRAGRSRRTSPPSRRATPATSNTRTLDC